MLNNYAHNVFIYKEFSLDECNEYTVLLSGKSLSCQHLQNEKVIFLAEISNSGVEMKFKFTIWKIILLA